jgi:glycerophosphoryl diester phosphodiesterase
MRWRRLPDIRSWVPRLQAHRGFWIEGIQQNTLDSIVKAVELNYQMAEFDVRLTKDYEVVLFHDEHILNQALSTLNFIELKQKASENNLKISTVEDVFVWFQKQMSLNKNFDFKLNIEIKSKFILNNRLEKSLYKLIAQYNMQKHILISSFNPLSLFRIKKLDSQIIRALLLTEAVESNFLLKKMVLNFLCQPDLIHLRFEDFKKTKYFKLNEKVPVVLWTVNDLEFYESRKHQIHGIISDSIIPEKFK